MSPDLRCFVLLKAREDQVLRLILKDYGIEEISKKIDSSIPVVKKSRRILFEKFRARTVIHLIVIAILERKYFDVLIDQNSPNKKMHFDRAELEIAFLVLQGRMNDEISALTGLSIKSVEYKRLKLRQKLNANGHADFVRKCLQYGLLVMSPLKYCFKSTFVDNVKIKTNYVATNAIMTEQNYDNINDTGFLYLDYLNRFFYVYHTQEDCLRKTTAMIIALCLSDFNAEYIKRAYYSRKCLSNSLIGSMIDSVKEYDTKLFVKEEIDKGNVKINTIKNAPWPENYSLGQRFILQQSLEGGVSDKTLIRLRMSRKAFNQNVKRVRKMWGSPTDIGVLMTFLHLDYLSNDILK